MERPDIGRRRTDRGHKRILDPAVRSLQLLGRHPQLCCCKHRTVKLLRVPQQRGIAFFSDGSHNLLYRLVLLRCSVLHLPLQLEILA
ncbi:hypothetical protein D3C75_948750 [compost metagenome]